MNWLFAVEEQSVAGWSYWSIAGWAALGFVIAVIVFNLKDILRYIRISTM